MYARCDMQQVAILKIDEQQCAPSRRWKARKMAIYSLSMVGGNTHKDRRASCP